MALKIDALKRQMNRYGAKSVAQADIKRLMNIAILARDYMDSGDDKEAWSKLVDAICAMEGIAI
jgi:hypothetical protein